MVSPNEKLRKFAPTLDDDGVAPGGAPGAHNHAGEDITTGTVAEARVASTIARDSELPDLAGHVAAADPHTGYRLESADHTHATTGAEAGKIAQAASHESPDTDVGTSSLHHTLGTGANQSAAGDHAHSGVYPAQAAFDDHSARHDAGGADALAIDAAQATGSLRTISTAGPQAIGTQAAGNGTAAASSNHVHPTGAGTPSTQAFGDAAATGSGPAAAMTDHKHAMPADPVTAHNADTTPHDIVFVDTPNDVAINDTNDVTVNTQDVTGVAAGDQLLVDAWFTILNNSGATRNIIITLDFDGAFDLELTLPALAVSATLIHPVRVQAILDVRSTSLAYAMVFLDMQLAAGIASGTDTTAAATHLQAKGWGTSGSNLTGTVTVALKARSANATATQTLRLHSHTIRKVTPT